MNKHIRQRRPDQAGDEADRHPSIFCSSQVSGPPIRAELKACAAIPRSASRHGFTSESIENQWMLKTKAE
jgi:hypothetical protein